MSEQLIAMLSFFAFIAIAISLVIADKRAKARREADRGGMRRHIHSGRTWWRYSSEDEDRDQVEGDH